MELKHRTFHKGNNVFECVTEYENIPVSKCQINISDDDLTWTITSWFTRKEYCHKGIGRESLKALIHYLNEMYKRPVYIQYIWNGANQYVMDWLETNFDAKCNCPIAVQKTQADDDWNSHIYTLNVDKILTYFK